MCKPLGLTTGLQESEEIVAYFNNTQDAISKVLNVGVEKRVNIAVLKLLSLEKPVYKAVPWLMSENLDFSRVPTIPGTKKSTQSA